MKDRKIERALIHLEDSENGFHFQLDGTTSDLGLLLATVCSANPDFKDILKTTAEMIDDAEVMEDVDKYVEELKAISSEQKSKMN